MKSYMEASGGEQEHFLREIPALPHVTVIARKRLSLPIYQKQLLNISAFASIFNKKSLPFEILQKDAFSDVSQVGGM